MVAPRHNLTGGQYGRLSVLRHDGRLCLCLCACEQVVIIPSTRLRCGNTRSCGCLLAELAGQRLSKLSRPDTEEWMELLDTLCDEVLTKHPQRPSEIRAALRDVWGHVDDRRFWRLLRVAQEQGRAARIGIAGSKCGSGSAYYRVIHWRRNLANCIADAAATYAVFELGYRRAA